MHHELKLHSDYFCQTVAGRKQWELRLNDRDFQTGDTVNLREWNGMDYTGAFVSVRIVYVLHHYDYPEGIMPGYCIFSHVPCGGGLDVS